MTGVQTCALPICFPVTIRGVKGFFESAKARGVDEIGISEHTHGFKEFKELYYKDLILDNSFVGENQAIWLKTNKFKNTIDEYETFINMLKSKGYPVKMGIEVCNFQDQKSVKEILAKHNFDYIIGSIHFVEGWAYDTSSIKKEWDNSVCIVTGKQIGRAHV